MPNGNEALLPLARNVTVDLAMHYHKLYGLSIGSMYETSTLPVPKNSNDVTWLYK